VALGDVRPGAPPSALYRTLHAARLIDPGTGATWQALEDRGLAQCRHVPDVFGVPLQEVQITLWGHKVVQSAIGEQRPKAAPKGQLGERQWAALARLYAAGDAGELSEEMMYGRGGFEGSLRQNRSPLRQSMLYCAVWSEKDERIRLRDESLLASLIHTGLRA
jgi:hypothetical protein